MMKNFAADFSTLFKETQGHGLPNKDWSKYLCCGIFFFYQVLKSQCVYYGAKSVEMLEV